MRLMGTKTPAKRAMQRAGLNVINGSDGVLADAAEAKSVAERVGFPVLLKAESGGGGRGMRIARAADDVERAYQEASAEALAAFGDGRLYLEKLIEGGRHVEIQLMGDKYGDVVHLGERDCSVQRKHQKLIEESLRLPTHRRRGARASTLDRGGPNATRVHRLRRAQGTMEFLLDDGRRRSASWR